MELHRTGDLSGTQAAGAGVHSLGGPVNDRLYTTDIGLPAAVGPSVRVGHTDTEGNALAAEFTFCHCSAPPSVSSAVRPNMLVHGGGHTIPANATEIF